MATNKPPGDNARKGAVRKRSQLKTKMEGEAHRTKRSREDGQFMVQKKDPEAKPYKGVRRERTPSGLASALGSITEKKPHRLFDG